MLVSNTVFQFLIGNLIMQAGGKMKGIFSEQFQFLIGNLIIATSPTRINDVIAFQFLIGNLIIR